MKKFLKKYAFEAGIIILSVMLVGLVAFAAFSSGPDSDSTSDGKWKIAVETAVPLNLGNIPIRGGKVSAKFTLKNSGTEPLTILAGQTSCMCTVATLQKNGNDVSPRITMPGHANPGPTKVAVMLAPNEQAELVAIFDPMAHGPNAVGPIKRDVILTTDSADTPQIDLSFFWNVVQ